uniref:Uncharacterized protein n=1 Tax=Triticum urartu TaxID=4572 RepID=A0A8R7UUB7_TRIUA
MCKGENCPFLGASNKYVLCDAFVLIQFVMIYLYS